MTTTLLMLSSKGRTFRAEASISQAELPTMRECGEMVGYIINANRDAVSANLDDSILPNRVIVPAECMPEGVTAFWLGRDENGLLDERRCVRIQSAS